MQLRLILESVGRYSLGLIMIAYGSIKLFGAQFKLPLSIYDIPLGSLDGVSLTWAFLGYNSWFSILLGVFEFVPGVLLLFSRTKLIGGILLLPITVGVFIVNIAYDFVPHMKVFTGCLLLLNILLLAVHSTLLGSIINKMFFGRAENPKAEAIINLILIAVLVFFIIFYLR